MSYCEQTSGMNMIQHGKSVHHQYKLLIHQLTSNSHTCNELQNLWNVIGEPKLGIEELKLYHEFHDCGKHLCLSIDENGRRHYPNHASISALQFSMIFPNDSTSRELIARDMDWHVLRGDDLSKIVNHPYAWELYLTAWAEINSNAGMFGGIESVNYKIKKKHLIKSGKKLADHTGELL